jgi:phosphoenolpyruvate carboxykinase (GTP)
MIKEKHLITWVNKMAKLCEPNKIHWCDGSDEENRLFINQLVESKKARPLNEKKRPNSYAFFSDPSDVARVENRTFIASRRKSDAGPTNNWVKPSELKKTMKALYQGSMRGRTMYVIPFMMGPFGSKFSKIGIQLTDSLYVVINMRLMTRMGQKVLDELKEKDEFIPCLHSVGYPLKENQEDLLWPSASIEKKYISHFPEERLIWSYGSGYGGNALLGKKCLALRIASKIAKDEMWMAEHMLILKVTNPEGRSKYILAAFPSACGKTNLAMLVPTLKNWKVETIGDDIAWIWKKENNKLYAINPERGFFGVAKGTSFKSNPSAMKSIAKNTIFTNVAITDDNDVWWEGIDGEIPNHLTDWQGNDWTKDSLTPAAHPNSRFTVSIDECPVVAKEWDDPEGVEISAILVGGRRSNTIPLVHEAYDFEHGIFMGSMMGSEITAASISNLLGHVRRDPFAMLPFIGYHVGDYLNHWFEMKKEISEKDLPKIYYVNWFRKDENNEFFWPGFGDNIRVLKWIFERVDGQAEAIDTPIGKIPSYQSIDLSGLAIDQNHFDKMFEIKKNEWLIELKSIRNFYESIGKKLPIQLNHILNNLESRIKQIKDHNLEKYNVLKNEIIFTNKQVE